MKTFFLLNKYQRITSTNTYIPEIDGLRFIAIITVLFLHLNTNFKRVFAEIIPASYNGSLLDSLFLSSSWGVELFFAISGYILSVPFIRYCRYRGKKVDISDYFKRRLSRLEPPFILSLLIIYIANLLISSYSFEQTILHFLATLFYSHMLIYGTWSNINPVTWSLETEVQFYIIAPLLIYLFSIKKEWIYRLIIFGLFTVSINSVGLPIMKQLHFHKSIIPSLHWFLIGILFADFHLQFPNWFKKQSMIADAFAWMSVPLLYMSKLLWGNLVFDATLLLFLVSTFKSISFKKVICNRFVTTIGGMCYTIYLFHYAGIFVLMNLLKDIQVGGLYIQLIVIFIICLLVLMCFSFILFRYFERPFMNKNWISNLRQGLIEVKTIPPKITASGEVNRVNVK